MSKREAKTGQSIDLIKGNILIPALINSIAKIPDLNKSLSIIDIGAGDATNSLSLVEILISVGYQIENIALADVDVKVFPHLLGNMLNHSLPVLNQQFLEVKNQNTIAKFLQQFGGQYDIALSQLVLHQIKNIHETSYLMYFAHRALLDNGHLLIVNLHPKYLDYLTEHIPEKFRLLKTYDYAIEGEYFFDSGGSNNVFSRNIETQLSMFLSLGFDLVKFSPIFTTILAHQKNLYQELEENNVPMFYAMLLKKNPNNFVSGTEGTVKKIKEFNPQWIKITFMDDSVIEIPKFSGWENVKAGSFLVLHEIHHDENGITIFNYWILSNDESETKTGGQLVVREK